MIGVVFVYGLLRLFVPLLVPVEVFYEHLCGCGLGPFFLAWVDRFLWVSRYFVAGLVVNG